MNATTDSPTTQLQTLRTSADRALETWREVLAFYRERGDRRGIAVATISVYQIEMVASDIAGLLVDVEAGR